MHMVVNRVPGGGTSAIIQTVWRKYGKNDALYAAL